MKRAMEEYNDEQEKSSKKSSRQGQSAFRRKLTIRDGACVITGSPFFEAAHIIPVSFYKQNDHLWAQNYERFCLVQEDGINDVRNGLLLSPTVHNLFDKYLFTIVAENGIYKIKKGNIIIPDFVEKTITFGPNADMWPHEVVSNSFI